MKSRILLLMTVFLMIFTYGKSQAARIATATVNNTEVRELHLPPAEKGGGKPFMEVLNERKSSRNFSERELEPHILSNLLWATNGINREENGKRTAPSDRKSTRLNSSH